MLELTHQLHLHHELCHNRLLVIVIHLLQCLDGNHLILVLGLVYLTKTTSTDTRAEHNCSIVNRPLVSPCFVKEYLTHCLFFFMRRRLLEIHHVCTFFLHHHKLLSNVNLLVFLVHASTTVSTANRLDFSLILLGLRSSQRGQDFLKQNFRRIKGCLTTIHTFGGHQTSGQWCEIATSPEQWDNKVTLGIEITAVGQRERFCTFYRMEIIIR
mmetsp:Transcript_1785/g.3086  ORF Transcript_1785/g.3086 Transcript_1785/m.3086 type:complete len:212 (-) Transcript_1785:1984-2619(-)